MAHRYLSIPVKDTATFISVAETQPFLIHHPKKRVAKRSTAKVNISRLWDSSSARQHMLLCFGFCVGCADKLMDVEVWYCSVKIRQLEHSAEQVVLCSQPAVGKLGGEVHRPNPTSVLCRRILVVVFFVVVVVA